MRWIPRLLALHLALAPLCLVGLPEGGSAQEVPPIKPEGKTRVVVRKTERFTSLENTKEGAGKAVPFNTIFEADDKPYKGPDGKQYWCVHYTRNKKAETGFVRADDVREWKFRTVLSPVAYKVPQSKAEDEEVKKKLFSFQFEGKRLVLPPVPGDQRVYAYVTRKPKNFDVDYPDYDVFVAAGQPTNEKGRVTESAEALERRKMALELVFVLEGSDFMLKPFGGVAGAPQVLEVMKELIRELKADLVAHMKANGMPEDLLRLGIVQYWDNVEWQGDDRDPRRFAPRDPFGPAIDKLKEYTAKKKFPSQVVRKLGEGLDGFDGAVKGLEAIQLLDDWPDDVLGGLGKAIGPEAGWSEQSIKEVVLIGAASFQMEEKGKGRIRGEQFPVVRGKAYRELAEKEVAKALERREPLLSVTAEASRFTLDRVLLEAYPEDGGGGIRELRRRHLHAILLPHERPALPTGRKPGEWEELDGLWRRFWAAETPTDLQNAYNALQCLDFKPEERGLKNRLMLVEHQYELAKSDYKSITAHRGTQFGMFAEVKWTADRDELKRAVRESISGLGANLKGALTRAKAFREKKEVKATRGDNPFADHWYQLAATLEKEGFYDKVYDGVASARPKGSPHELAETMVFVTKQELRKAANNLRTVKEAYAKAKPDAGAEELLERTRAALSMAISGATPAEVEKLKKKDLADLINPDLPFQSTALRTTLEQLNKKTPKERREWFEDLEAAAKELDELCKKNPAEHPWCLLGGDEAETAPDDATLYRFIKLTEFP